MNKDLTSPAVKSMLQLDVKEQLTSNSKMFNSMALQNIYYKTEVQKDSGYTSSKIRMKMHQFIEKAKNLRKEKSERHLGLKTSIDASIHGETVASI